MSRIGFIYKLINEENESFYVGSTRNMQKRFYRHQRDAVNYSHRNHKIKLYEIMREIGIKKFSIELLECLQYKEKQELLLKEREWIEKLSPDLNCVLPIVTTEETKERVKKWHSDNKEHVKNYKANHHLENKEEIRKKDNLKNQTPEMLGVDL